jgi:hypothetical protein
MTKMKKIFITGLCALLLGLSLAAQETQTKVALQHKAHTWKVAGQLGLQTGGAVPVPMSAISGAGGAANVHVKLYPQMAARVSRRLSDKWWAYAGLNYAASGFMAKARIKNQRIRDENGDLVYFTGISHVEMAFAYAELPVCAEYAISSRHKLLMGLYSACKVSGTFKTTALKGFTGVNPNSMGAEVQPSDNIRTDFSSDLRRWDFGVLLGYEFVLLSRLNAGLHLNFSPLDIFKSAADYFDYTMHPLRGCMVLSYDLFRR